MSTEELELGKDALTPLSDRSLPVEIIPKLFIGIPCHLLAKSIDRFSLFS